MLVRLPAPGAGHVPLGDALGLVAARPIVSGEAVPPFANSSMDGYALRAGDVAAAPTRLRVVGGLMAGDDPSGVVVGEGEAVRIMTGAAGTPKAPTPYAWSSTPGRKTAGS